MVIKHSRAFSLNYLKNFKISLGKLLNEIITSLSEQAAWGWNIQMINFIEMKICEVSRICEAIFIDDIMKWEKFPSRKVQTNLVRKLIYR